MESSGTGGDANRACNLKPLQIAGSYIPLHFSPSVVDVDVEVLVEELLEVDVVVDVDVDVVVDVEVEVEGQ